MRDIKKDEQLTLFYFSKNFIIVNPHFPDVTPISAKSGLELKH